MIGVRRPLQVEADPRGGWRLTFWVMDAFDYTTPFRTMLVDIAEALGQHPRNDLKLPKQGQHEDFVEGTLRFGDASLQVYYEHSLSYLTLGSNNEGALQDAATRLRPRVIVV